MSNGNHPNSRKALEENRAKGQFSGERAVEMGRKSAEARVAYKSLNQDLRERCTPERLAKINERLLQMAEHGNLRAYELARDGLGEKPTEKHEVTINDDSMREMDEFFQRADNEPAEE
jgi:hypothetical protein